MRLTAAVAAVICLLGSGQAYAAGHGCATAARAGRVMATLAVPTACCTGRMRCAQYLSTTTVMRPAHDQRT